MASMGNLELQLIPLEKVAKKAKKEADDPRRDEWSTEAIYSLLDVYEGKWNQRNRGNLKGGDWEDVAIRVSSRGDGTKGAKTPFQCKNKVASMKQKYRSEVLLKGIHGSSSSRWPFFGRMELMFQTCTRHDGAGSPGCEIRGMGGMQGPVTDIRLHEALQQIESGDSEQEGAIRKEHGLLHGNLPQEKLQSLEGIAHNHESNQDDASNTLPQRKLSGAQESETSTHRKNTGYMQTFCGKATNKHSRHLTREVAASIRQFADAILKMEKAKMEIFRDSERIRVELEARRADMELKRIEIITNTQLQIAKLLSPSYKKKRCNKSAQAMSPSPSNNLSPEACTGSPSGAKQHIHTCGSI